MNLLRCILVIQFTTALALGQPAPTLVPSAPPKQPETLVRAFYQQVVAHNPHDIPESADLQVLAPYLSKALLHRIDLAKACSADWDRQNPETHRTSAYGPFSGEGADPQLFRIERSQFEQDGTFRVYVKLTAEKPPERPWTWRVAAVVMRENGHYVIDDAVYINDNVYDNVEQKPADIRLSEYLSAGCNGPHWIGNSLPTQPDALARSLYQQVVARRPVGIPWGADWKTFAPYLSKALLHRINLALDCGDDWNRQDHRRMLMKDQVIEKPPLGWSELGLFSAGDAEDELRDFQVEKIEPEKDGSSRVYVKLTWGWPPEKPWISHVAPILVPENGRLVVDDVTYLNDEEDKSSADYRLSQALSEGCDGPHWVGDRDQRNDPKQER